MNKISRSENKRVPEPFEGIQINFCKNPICPNFGVPASAENQSRGRYADLLKQDYYRKRRIDGIPHLTCKFCGETFPLKSNRGIYEETSRISDYLIPEPEPSCPKSSCPNHEKGIKSHKHCYIYWGKTPSGSPRYKCKACKKPFAVTEKSTARQRKSHLNKYIFKALMNKNPLKCICDIYDISMTTLYGKIDFLYKQCRKFVAARERKLLSGMQLPKLYVGVDRQYFSVNWKNADDRRNIILYAVGSADNESGYVFSMDLNYDPNLNPNEIEERALDLNDYGVDAPYRRYARLWLKRDFERRTKKKNAGSMRTRQSTVKTKIELEKHIINTYSKAIRRKDIESGDEPSALIRLPQTGIMVHLEYSLYAHFLHLKRLLSGAEKVRFLMDQESGIRAAALAAFKTEIKNRTCDVFYVSINKEMTRDEREFAQREGRKLVKEYCNAHSGISERDARLHLLIERIEEMDEFGQWRDRWFTHPFPTLGEPEKKVCHLTDLGDYDIEHRAWLFNKASLHGINTYFANIRRKLSLLERPFGTPSSLGSKWYGYSPYNPEIINKLLLIHRVHYNYVKNREQKITPAMKFGLARGPVDPHDIIYGRVIKEPNARSFFFPPFGGSIDFLKDPEPGSLDISIAVGQGKPDNKNSQVAASINSNENTVFLDTETTGVSLNDQIIEIAIVDNNGNMLLNSLVNTDYPISFDTHKIHGISKDMVIDCPTIKQIERDIISEIKNKHVVIYHAEFDLRMLSKKVRDAMGSVSCCMRRFARFKGDINYRYGTYRWFSLKEACAHVGHKGQGKMHRALGDAMACRAVWQFIESEDHQIR